MNFIFTLYVGTTLNYLILLHCVNISSTAYVNQIYYFYDISDIWSEYIFDITKTKKNEWKRLIPFKSFIKKSNSILEA